MRHLFLINGQLSNRTTRQREVFNVFMENYDKYEEYKDVASNSTGSADEKMEYYKDSVEAAQNRMTAALEDLVTGEGIENVLIKIYNLIADGIDNIGTIATLLGTIVVLTKGRQIAGALTTGAGKMLGGYMGALGGFQNVFTGGYWGGLGDNFKNSIEMAQMDAFDMSLQKITATLQATDVSIAKLGEDALISGQSIVRNIGKDSTMVLGGMDVANRQRVAKLAGTLNYTPEQIGTFGQYSRYANLGVSFNADGSIADMGNAAKKLAKQDNITEEQAISNIKKFAQELQQATQAVKENAKAQQEEANASKNAANSDNQESQNSNLASQSDIQEASASELAMSADLQEAAGGKLSASQTSVVGGIVGTKGYGNSAKGLGRAGSAASAGIGMIGSIAGTSMVMAGSKDLGTGGTTALSSITSLAPMIGSFFGPWGAAIGGAISIATGVITWAITASHKTDEEILEEAQKASEELSKIRTQTKDLEDSLSNTQSQEGRFKELLKGVNVYTGQNVSLSDSEWSEYQEILSSLIDNNPNLYADYDENGNIIAKTVEGFADLNTVMSDTISLQKEELALKYKTLASDTEKLSSEILGSVLETEQSNAGVTTKKERDPMSLSYDSFGLDKTKSILEFGDIGVNDKDVTTEARKKYGWGKAVNNPIIDYIDVFESMKQGLMTLDEAQKILKHSEGIIDFAVGIFSGNGYNEKFTKEEIQQAYENYLEYGQDRTDQVEAVKQQYRADMFQNINYALLGNEQYRALSAQGQSLVSSMFRNLQVNPYTNESKLSKKSEKQIKKSLEDYQKAATDISQYFADNPILLSDFENYDQNTATAKDEQMLLSRWQDVLDTTDLSDEQKYALLKGKGYHASGFKWGTDENGNKVITKMGTWKTQRDINAETLSKDYNIDTDLLNQLTGIEFAKLFAQRDSFKDFTGTISNLRNQLKELVLGEVANASEYFASLTSELGLTTTNTKELIKAIQSGDADGSFGLSKLQEIADNLGITVETLVENISILGDINTFGQTEKSLSEIETQFEHIDAISQDLSDNGMISAENLETLINEFPELVQYIDDFDTLLSKLQDMGDLKTIKIQASIAGSIADSDKIFEDFVTNQLQNDTKKQSALKIYGNLSNLQNVTQNLYDFDEQGNATIKSYYEDMALRAGQTESGTYSDNSWAKFIAENRFGIDTSQGTVDEINQKLYEAMKTSAISAGISSDSILTLGNGGLTQLLSMYRDNLMNNPQYLLALQGVANAEANLKAGKAAKQVENEEWEKNLSKAISDLKDDYSAGRISIDDYIQGMEELSQNAHITEEQLKELKETIEDTKFEKLSKQFEDGAISVSKYRSELSALMKQNAKDSDDYEKYLDAYLGTFDTELDKLNGQKSLLYEKDYFGQRSLLNQENVVLTEKLAALEAAGLKNTKDYLDVLERIKTNKEEQLEISKQELEYQKEQLDNTMGAYNTLADYAIKQLEKERDLVEERYDEEIDKLQEVNDQKERSIELTKLQQELENAQKEKSRVYVGGIGFIYQANQAKIDEAEKNLEDYLAERKISDLENSKAREVKYYEEQIEFWNEVKGMVDDVSTLASTEDAVRQLIKDGILEEGTTIPNALRVLRAGTNLDNAGHVSSLGKKFENIEQKYLDNAARLWKVGAEWETNLKSIANSVGGFKNSTDMVDKFKQAFVAGASALKINVQVPKNSVNLAQLEQDLASAKAYLSTITNTVLTLGQVSVNGTADSAMSWDGRYRSAQKRTVNGVTYIRSDATDGWYSITDPNVSKGNGGTYTIKAGATRYELIGYASGLEAGAVSHTGLAMLHGTPQKPEYVLNNDQAWTLLKNFATLSLPAFDRKSSNKTINYQFYGDLHLPNVQDPSTFFEELLRQSSSQFNITQSEY